MSIPPGVFTAEWHEKKPCWTTVDEYTQSHLHPPTKPNHASLSATLSNSLKKGLPDIATYPIFSKLLALQCRASKVKHVLEVGTLGGYTPVFIATMNPDVHVTAVEVSQKHAEVARQNIEEAGVSNQVDIIVGSAVDILPNFLGEIQKGVREPFGLTYIDADKGNNWTYFDLAVKMSTSGSTIYVDNMVSRGELVMEEHFHNDDTGVPGARLVLENVGKDPRVEAVVQQTVGAKSYDGFLMAVVL